MNTSIQIKKHTNVSASNKQSHILRIGDNYLNPDIEIIKSLSDYKFQDEKVVVDKAILKDEKLRKKELQRTNNKINTYSKRLEIYKEKDDVKRVEKLTNQLNELKQLQAELKGQKVVDETRGKKKKIKYIEFELSLTRSNHLKDDIDVQTAIKNAVSQLQLEDDVFKELETITEVMHLDQYSLHIHLLTKLPTDKTWDSILKEQHQDGRKVYKQLEDKFNVLMRNELRELDLQLDYQQSGKKYIKKLSDYKEENPLELEQEQEIKYSNIMKNLIDNMEKNNNPKTKKTNSKDRKNQA